VSCVILALCDSALSFYRKSRGHDLIEIDKKKTSWRKFFGVAYWPVQALPEQGLALYYPGKPPNSSLLLKYKPSAEVWCNETFDFNNK
jgi:hypothetical protein